LTSRFEQIFFLPSLARPSMEYLCGPSLRGPFSFFPNKKPSGTVFVPFGASARPLNIFLTMGDPDDILKMKFKITYPFHGKIF
jgi:hypothetical protein